MHGTAPWLATGQCTHAAWQAHSVVFPSHSSLAWSASASRLGRLDDAVAMLGRAVDGVELERLAAGVTDIVARAGRDDHREIVLDRDCRPPSMSIVARAFLDAEELVAVLVDLLADLPPGWSVISTSWRWSPV